MRTVTLLPGGDPAGIDAVRAAVSDIEWEVVPLEEASLPRIIASVSTNRVALKGRTGPRPHPLNAMLRRGLDLVASTRRCMTFEGVPAKVPFADALVIRDNTRPRPGPIAPTTTAALQFAFRHTTWSSRKRIAIVGDPDFEKAALDLARDYPQLQVETRRDFTPAAEAGEADVLLLSAASADGGLWNGMIEAVGGARLCPGASYGADFAVFEADPVSDSDGPLRTAHLLSAAMLLEHLNEGMAADRLIKSVRAELAR